MNSRKLVNLIAHTVILVFALAALFPLFNVLIYVIRQGAPALNLDFFTQLPPPVGEAGGGIGQAIIGSAILISMASAISVPLGLGMGILLAEYSQRWISRALSVVIELLASIPSIVIGLFAYAVLVKPFKGFSAYAGALALAMIMVPMVAKTTQEMLKLVPMSVREAGLALGLPRYRMILQIVVRGSRKSILVGVMLAVARVAGETAPLLFTAFASQQWSQGLSQPIASIPVQIYTYAISPYEDWHQKAWGGALVLILMVLSLNLMIRGWNASQRRKS